MFVMTSMGGNIDHTINNGNGPYVFKLNGQNYYRIGSMLPPTRNKATFVQLYLDDTQNEIQNRITSVNNSSQSYNLDT